MENHFNNKSAYATIEDLKISDWRDLFNELDADQKYFIDNANCFRGDDYKWPKNALHNWSRAWEYPFIYRKIKEYGKSINIMDFGCGVTFFPHSLTKLGHDVTCVDNDPVCRRDTKRAGEFYSENKKSTGGIIVPDLGIEDYSHGEFDLVYSISVLEHIENPEVYVDLFFNMLKPGGRLLLTMDIDLRGDSQISALKLNLLKENIYEKFRLFGDFEFSHPKSYLTTTNSIYPYDESYFREAKRLLKRVVTRQPIWPYPMVSNYLCVLALDMIKA